MKVKENIKENLTGEKFDIPFIFNIKEKFPRINRIEKLLELTKGKKVLHLGCCDHLPIIKEKIENNTWLHKLLTENCNKVLGLDINKEAIEHIKAEFNFNNLIYCDITSEDRNKEILEEDWDYIVMGEILEHVNNPVEFLERIIKNYKENINKIIITVPNILCLGLIEKMIEKYGEIINPDHRYWFTPYTLLKIAENAGLKECELFFVEYFGYKKSKLKKINQKLKRILMGKKEKTEYFYNFGGLLLEANLAENKKQ